MKMATSSCRISTFDPGRSKILNKMVIMMKKFISILLVVVMLLGIVPMTAAAETAEPTDLEEELNYTSKAPRQKLL